jgi:hypothetical protein
MPFQLPASFNPGDQYTNLNVNAVAAAINALVNGIRTASVATNESTTSTTFTDLATVTDTVTVTIGQSGVAFVMLSALISTASGYGGDMGFALSGANTQAANVLNAIVVNAVLTGVSGCDHQVGGTFFVQGLVPGATTFKAKYAASGGASYPAQFANRQITVFPFP